MKREGKGDIPRCSDLSGPPGHIIARMKTNGPGLFRKITSAGLVSLWENAPGGQR